MRLFAEWLLLNEAAKISEDIIKNYADRLLQSGMTDGVHFDDLKTLISLGRKYVMNFPEEEKVDAFQKIRSSIYQVMAQVKDVDQTQLRKYFIDAFSFPSIEREMHIKGVTETNQRQFIDFIHDAMDDRIDYIDINRIIAKNPHSYSALDKSTRKEFVMHLIKKARELENVSPGKHMIILSILQKLNPTPPPEESD